MHLGGLDLNLLVVLDALFAEKSVTRAGQRVHLSQSATSAALGRLRQFFGDDLLVPAGHGMMLTPKALEFQERLRDLILRADGIAQSKTAFDPSNAKRHFRLMMSDYPATVLLPDVLAEILQAAPSLTFEVFQPGGNPSDHLDRGDTDLLIMPQQWMSSSHPSEELFRDRYVCAVWSENRLVKTQLTIHQYLDMGHVAVQFAGQPFPVLEEWFFEQLGHRRRIEVVASSFFLMGYLVPGTTRIATMHSLLAERCTVGLPIRLVKPPVEIPEVAESMQWHTHRDTDPGIVWLRQAFKSAAGRLRPARQQRPLGRACARGPH
jgi:LysR family nod box-dependent transcriptional activator